MTEAAGEEITPSCFGIGSHTRLPNTCPFFGAMPREAVA